MSYFSDMIAAGLADIQDAAGETVTYWRGDDYITITATPGDGQRRGQQAEVIRINSQRDWLILVSALNFGAGPVPPQRNDQVKFGSLVFEVLPQDGEDCYRAVGFDQYRVHTKVLSLG